MTSNAHTAQIAYGKELGDSLFREEINEIFSKR
jgi:hypothetical protein